MFNIDCDITMKNLDFDDKTFASNNQKSIILKELKNIFGSMYMGGQNTLIPDHLFIVTNIRVNEHMDAVEFEELLYKILSEKPFKDEIINISNDENDVIT